MVLDPGYVKRLLMEIQKHVAILREAQSESQEALFSDQLRTYGVLHTFQIAIEAIITCNHHLIAECELGTPERNIDAVAALRQAGILPGGELADNLTRMIRFRNLLVHRYRQVDLNQVYEVLQNNLEDFESYCSAVSNFLARQD